MLLYRYRYRIVCEWMEINERNRGSSANPMIYYTVAQTAHGDASILNWNAKCWLWLCAWGNRTLYADRISSFAVRITHPKESGFVEEDRTAIVVGVTCDSALTHSPQFVGYGVSRDHYGVCCGIRKSTGPRSGLQMMAVNNERGVSRVLTAHPTDVSVGSGFLRNGAVVGVVCDFDRAELQFFLDDQPTPDLSGPVLSPFVWPIRSQLRVRQFRPYFAALRMDASHCCHIRCLSTVISLSLTIKARTQIFC